MCTYHSHRFPALSQPTILHTLSLSLLHRLFLFIHLYLLLHALIQIQSADICYQDTIIQFSNILTLIPSPAKSYHIALALGIGSYSTSILSVSPIKMLHAPLNIVQNHKLRIHTDLLLYKYFLFSPTTLLIFLP